MRPFLLLLCLLSLVPVVTAQDEPLRELRAVKLTNVASDVLFSDAAIAEAMDDMAALGINAVLPVVWNSSGADGTHTLYPSLVMDTTFGRPIHPRFVGRDMLRRVVIEAHRNGMEVLPWFEMGFSPSFSQDGGYMLAQKPEWAALGVDGEPVVENGFDWMSATHPDVQAFIHDLTLEVAQNYDVDGVEYSDRIPAMPVRAGYDAATVALYRQEHGGADPPTNHTDAAWMRWRADRLNGFFRDVREAVKAEGADLTVAASPSLYPWAYQNYLQDSKTWMEEGISDHVIPQVYRRTLGEYTFELDKSLRNYPGMADRYFSGMLVRLGSYLIADDYLRDAIAANRRAASTARCFSSTRDCAPRADGSPMCCVRSTPKPALVPGREGVWRPPATMSARRRRRRIGQTGRRRAAAFKTEGSVRAPVPTPRSPTRSTCRSPRGTASTPTARPAPTQHPPPATPSRSRWRGDRHARPNRHRVRRLALGGDVSTWKQANATPSASTAPHPTPHR